MKNFLIKTTTAIVFSLNISACDLFTMPIVNDKNITGVWENTLKSSDSSSIITTLEVKDFKKVKESNYYETYTYSANLKSKLDGTPSDNVKLTTTDINISGEMRDNTASITDVESEVESITTNSRFELSKDRTYLTLMPGNIKFKKKK